MQGRDWWVLALASLGGCDDTLGPAAQSRQPQVHLSSSALDGSHTAPTEPFTAYYSSTLATLSTPTIIELKISGSLQAYWHSNAGIGDFWTEIDYRGVLVGAYDCHAPVVVAWGFANGTWIGGGSPCPPEDDGVTEFVRVVKASGTGQVFRSSLWAANSTSCGGKPCVYHQGEHVVSWKRMPANLQLTPGSTSVAPGQAVSFTVSADPATISGITTPLSVTSWTWRPDAGADSTVCGTSLSCTVYPREPGMLVASALVNGESQSQSVRIDVPTLSCGSAVTAGGTATCTATIPQTSTATISQWSFTGGNVTVAGPTTGYSWSGSAVLSGTVTVNLTFDGSPLTLSAPLTVSRRSWSWAGQVGGQPGAPGEIDACMTSGMAGLMSGTSCNAANRGVLFTPIQVSNGAGYVATQIQDSGPNNGLWYISSVSATMQLRTQVHRELRQDGPAYPVTGNATISAACLNAFGDTLPRNTHEINTTCDPQPDLANLVNFAWNHEGRHMTAALAEAQRPTGDVHLRFEPLVATSESSLQALAFNEYFAAHTAVSNAANSTHTGNSYPFTFWRYVNGGWATATTTVLD